MVGRRSSRGGTVASEDWPLLVRVLARLVTAVVAVVVLEVVGLALYLAVLKPNVLDTLLSDPGPLKVKLLVAGNGDVFLVAAALAAVGLAFAFRSKPTTDAADETGTVEADGGTASESDTDHGDATGGFSFGDGE